MCVYAGLEGERESGVRRRQQESVRENRVVSLLTDTFGITWRNQSKDMWIAE